MKTRLGSLLLGLMVMASFRAAGQGTAFTYQGRLSDSGSPANGNYDLQFYLRDALAAGNPVGVTNTLAPVPVSGGLFTVTLDFGANIFDGSARWLEIGVRTNGSGSAFTTLAPRQPVTPTPYAVYAANAGSAAAALLATNATTANGVAPNSVTGAGIQDGTITSAKLADGATTSAKLGDGSVTPAKLSTAGATAGQILKYNGTQWALAAANDTAYSAGAGLALSGTSFSVSFAGSGSETTASRSDHDHLGGFWIGSGGLSLWNTNGPGPFGSSVSLNGFSLADGTGVSGSSASGIGLSGRSTSGTGVDGGSDSGYGVSGLVTSGTTNAGVYGKSLAVNGSGVLGQADLGTSGYGVWGKAAQGKGVVGASTSGYGVYGSTEGTFAFSGVYGLSTGPTGHGVIGEANHDAGAAGVYGKSSSGYGVYGQSTASGGTGILGEANQGTGATGVQGQSSTDTGVGVLGKSRGTGGHGVHAEATGSSGIGLYAKGPTGIQVFGNPAIDAWGLDPGTGQFGVAARFAGEVDCGVIKATGIFGTELQIQGTKNFRIDHPLDPANKYLYHASIESSDVMNLYNGNATLDTKGEAVVQLPNWFGALNADFRYQLTAIGAPGPNLYIAQEITNNHFKIAGGKAGTKVSWQVTGVRQDPYIKAHPMTVEEEKTGAERGKYVYPEGYGLSAADGINPIELAKTRPARSRTRFQAEPNKTSDVRQATGD